jgi:2-phosphosulfolactate phosphatase
VIDVMFATSTIVAALAAGAREVVPALDPDDARRLAQALPAESFLLAGERNLDLIPGFAPPYPLAIAAAAPGGRTLVYSTTNGTVALRGSTGAAAVYATALLNAPATARQLLHAHAEDDWLIVCAGSRANASMEDLFAAGLLVDALAGTRTDRWLLSDNAAVARTVFRGWSPVECLRASRLGRVVTDLGHAAELEYSARVGEFDFVCPMQGGSIRRAQPAAVR